MRRSFGTKGRFLRFFLRFFGSGFAILRRRGLRRRKIRSARRPIARRRNTGFGSGYCPGRAIRLRGAPRRAFFEFCRRISRRLRVCRRHAFRGKTGNKSHKIVYECDRYARFWMRRNGSRPCRVSVCVGNSSYFARYASFLRRIAPTPMRKPILRPKRSKP